MSYNGIGLQTPRGSGTSGYVQKSLTGPKTEGLRRKRQREAQEELSRQERAHKKQIRKGASTEIDAHDRKRWIEVKCMELRDKLEEDGMEDEEVENRVSLLRQKLTGEAGSGAGKGGDVETEKLEKNTVESAELQETTELKLEKETEIKLEKETTKVKLEKSHTRKSASETETETGKQLLPPSALTKPYAYVPRYTER